MSWKNLKFNAQYAHPVEEIYSESNPWKLPRAQWANVDAVHGLEIPLVVGSKEYEKEFKKMARLDSTENIHGFELRTGLHNKAPNDIKGHSLVAKRFALIVPIGRIHWVRKADNGKGWDEVISTVEWGEGLAQKSKIEGHRGELQLIAYVCSPYQKGKGFVPVSKLPFLISMSGYAGNSMKKTMEKFYYEVIRKAMWETRTPVTPYMFHIPMRTQDHAEVPSNGKGKYYPILADWNKENFNERTLDTFSVKQKTITTIDRYMPYWINWAMEWGESGVLNTPTFPASPTSKVITSGQGARQPRNEESTSENEVAEQTVKNENVEEAAANNAPVVEHNDSLPELEAGGYFNENARETFRNKVIETPEQFLMLAKAAVQHQRTEDQIRTTMKERFGFTTISGDGEYRAKQLDAIVAYVAIGRTVTKAVREESRDLHAEQAKKLAGLE